MKWLVFNTVPLLLLAACNRSPRDYLTTGNKFFAEKNYAEAQLNYSKAIQKNPQLGEAYYRLGLTLVKQDQGVPAYQALHKAIELLPKQSEAKVALADVCFAFYFSDQRRPKALYEEIAEMASQLLQLDPNSPDGFRLKGALSLLDLKPAESVEFYRKANELRPMNGEIVLGYTQALFQSGRAPEAERLASAFLSKNPTFSPVYDAIYGQYMVTNRLADAENILRQWIAKNPKDSTAVLKLAGHYSRLQKHAEMYASLQRMLDAPANYPKGQMDVGDFYARLGRWTDAAAQYKRGAQMHAQDSAAYQKKVVGVLVAQGKHQDAVGLLDALIKQTPNDVEARATRARLWLENGPAVSVDAAVAEFQALLKDHSKDATLHYDLGRAYLLKGDTPAARASFLQAVQLRNDVLAPRYELAQLALSQQNPGELLRYADEILQLKPGDPRGRFFRASGLMGSGRLPEARSELRSLLKDYPLYRDAQIQTGLLAVIEKKFKEAEEIFRKLSEAKSEDFRPELGLATAYSSQKQYDRAIQVLTDAAKKSPGSAAVQNLLALTALEAHRYDLAIESFQKVVTANPKSVEAYVRLAQAYRLSGNPASVLTTLEKAQQLDPRDAPSLMTLSSAFFGAGRLDVSRDLLRRVVQLQANNASALNNLAYLIVETAGDLNEAQKFAEMAVQKDANDTHNQDTLAWVYLNKNMVDSALQVFEKLVAKEPENATFRYHLGAALLKKGDKTKARAELTSALAKKPDPAEEKSIKELLARIG